MESRKCENPECENIVTEYQKNKPKELKMYCSTACCGRYNSLKSRDKAKATCLKNHGVEHHMILDKFKEKIKQTNLERHGNENPMSLEKFKNKLKDSVSALYGVENVFQSPEIKEIIKQTNLERHGVEYPMQSVAIQRKQKNTCLNRYNVENVFQSPEIKDKLKTTLLYKHNVDHPMKSNSVKEKCKETNMLRYGGSSWANSHIPSEIQLLLDNKTFLQSQNETKPLEEMAHELNINSLILSRRFKKFNIPVKRHAKSFFEKQVYAYILSLRPSALNNDRTQIKPFELDVYLPDLNLAFECNGEPWHKDEQKEINKYNMAKTKNIDLYFIWYKDWKKDQEKMKNFIKDQITIRLTKYN